RRWWLCWTGACRRMRPPSRSGCVAVTSRCHRPRCWSVPWTCRSTTPYWRARRWLMSEGQDVTQRLLGCLKELHLPTLRASCQELAREGQREGLRYEQYLLTLLERECQERRNKRAQRWLHESRLPLEKSWQALDLKRLPAKVVQQARTPLEGSFVDRHENVL